jgi:ATP-dependent RNA helicase RhlE
MFGGVSQNPQVHHMSKGVDMLIATPGRLLDLINQGHVSLRRVSFLVLDEADRMLDMGFINDIRKIIAVTNKERQTMLFSATMPTAISGLAHSILKNPVKMEVTPQVVTVERIDQTVYPVKRSDKGALLVTLLQDAAMDKVIVFSKTKHGANRILSQLHNAGITAGVIHGNKSQGARQKALEGFKNGEVRVLVATDIVARGIDVDNISHVINYDLPDEPESYVHRIGRTARAGAGGKALAFCDETEGRLLRDIERLTRRSLRQMPLPALVALKPLAHAKPERAHSHHPRQGAGRPPGGGRPGSQGRNRRPQSAGGRRGSS